MVLQSTLGAGSVQNLQHTLVLVICSEMSRNSVAADAWAFCLLYSVATLCVHTNHKIIAAVKVKTCARDTCIGTMCIE